MKRVTVDPRLTAVFGKWMTAAMMLTTAYAESPTAQSPMPMRDTATHEELTIKLRQASQAKPTIKLQSKTGVDPSKVNRPESLLANSDIVCFGDMAVLVPKRAILQSPPNLADRLKLRSGTRFVSWADFYAANRGWITTVEVNRTQAEGKEPVQAMSEEHIKKSAHLIVAVYEGGPISVLPLAAPPATPATETITKKSKP